MRLCEAIPDCEEYSWQPCPQDAFWLQKSRRLGTARCDTLNTRNILFLGEVLSVHCDMCVNAVAYANIRYISLYCIRTLHTEHNILYLHASGGTRACIFFFLDVFRFAPRSDGSLAYEGSWSCKKPLKLFHDVPYANKKGMESNRFNRYLMLLKGWTIREFSPISAYTCT